MVSVLSHEIGEWADDPLTLNYNSNNTPCGILEVGDPLEGNPNYGAHPYKLNRFTYNLQDLVTLPYFGAPIGTSISARNVSPRSIRASRSASGGFETRMKFVGSRNRSWAPSRT